MDKLYFLNIIFLFISELKKSQFAPFCFSLAQLQVKSDNLVFDQVGANGEVDALLCADSQWENRKLPRDMWAMFVRYL